MIENLRNIAIIAHVDHGKTTLVDKLLQQSGTFDARAETQERVMDSNDLEKERGITILAKNTAIKWNDYRINIVDTPGHADFGGEVERVMSMVDSVLLVVDAMDGPMPQTRFVTKKAFAHGLKPIVVINKVDRPGARPDWVVDQVFDLFVNLDATDEQLDFPIVYASALNGIAGLDHEDMAEDMTPLYQTIVDRVPAPNVDLDGPLQMQISQLDYNNYVGVIGIGRIKRGKVKPNQQVTIIDSEGKTRNGKVGKVLTHLGLERIESDVAEAGDIMLERQSFSLTYMLRQMIEEFYPMLGDKNQKICLEQSRELYAEGDPDKLARVFNNLLKNAIAYGDRDSEIRINVEETGKELQITIENQGRQIPPQKLELLFEKFYRLDDSRASDTGNAGLGLAIAREIVELHGGSVQAESREHAVAFIVKLPKNGEVQKKTQSS